MTLLKVFTCRSDIVLLLKLLLLKLSSTALYRKTYLKLKIFFTSDLIKKIFRLLFLNYQVCVSVLVYIVGPTVALILQFLLLSTKSREEIFVTQAMATTVHVSLYEQTIFLKGF